MTWDYAPPGQYPSLTDAELLDALARLVQDLVDLRRDLSNLSAQHNSRFFETFLASNGESVAGRNRLAEAETLQLTNEKVECEANIAADEDLCNLIRTILRTRRNRG